MVTDVGAWHGARFSPCARLGRQRAVGRRRTGDAGGGARLAPRLPNAHASHGFCVVERRPAHPPARPAVGCACSRSRRSPCSPWRAAPLVATLLQLERPRPGFETHGGSAPNVGLTMSSCNVGNRGFIVNCCRARQTCGGTFKGASRVGSTGRGVTPVVPAADWRFRVEGSSTRTYRRSARATRSVTPGFFAASAAGSAPAATSTTAIRLGSGGSLSARASRAKLFPGHFPIQPPLDATDGIVKLLAYPERPHRRRDRRYPRCEHRSRAMMTLIIRLEQELGGGRSVRATRGPIRMRGCRSSRAPCARWPRISRAERAATLDDVKAEVLAPDRLNAIVFGGFAACCAGDRMWASRACWRFRSAAERAEFGIRLAIHFAAARDSV